MHDDVTADSLRQDPIAAIERDGNAVVVRVAGELDLYNAEAMREALLEQVEAAPERLVVDLSGVFFVDSTALGVLVEARRRLANPQAFLLAGPGVEARRALETSGLDRHFRVHESLEDALAAAI